MSITTFEVRILKLLLVAKACKSKTGLFPVPESLMPAVAQWIGKASIADRCFGFSVVDDSKARQMLGWRSPSSMDEQLQKTAQHDSRV